MWPFFNLLYELKPMKRIPFLLIYSRIVIAILIVIITLLNIENQKNIVVILMITGVLTDIFDGIIARKLRVATKKLRIWDSNVDQFFWVLCIGSICYSNFQFLKENYTGIGIVILLEIVAYLSSYFRFKKTIATHSLLAKFWVLILLVFLIDLMLNDSSDTAFLICLIIGILSRLEIIAIIFTIKQWTTDIPSIFKVSAINKGIVSKKRILF